MLRAVDAIPQAQTETEAKAPVSLLYKTHPLILLPELALAIGIREALFMQQLFYWQTWKVNNTREGAATLIRAGGRTWVYNTMQQWSENLPITPRTLRRIVGKLKKARLIDVWQPNKSSGDCTNFYSINETRFSKMRETLEAEAAASEEKRKKKKRNRGKTMGPKWPQG